MRNKMRNKMTQSEKLDTFLARKAEIDTALARLQALSHEHFNTDPEGITWGDIGTISDIAEKLKAITDLAFQEGEYRQ